MRGKRAVLLVVGLALATGGADVNAGTSAPEGAAGTLNLQTVLRLQSQLGDYCPPGVAASFCAQRTAQGVVRGLGSVAVAYTYIVQFGPPSCTADTGRARGSPVRFVVAAKGELHVALAEGAQCVDEEAARTQAQAYTVTGGTGIYAGASGSGTVERTLARPSTTGQRIGTETWRGTLSVPGLEFDTTPPNLRGAVAKTVRAPRRAKRVRVRFSVTARDDVDGAVAASCEPASGSRFRIGRTVVTCSATDTSGNTRTARFTVTVKRRR